MPRIRVTLSGLIATWTLAGIACLLLAYALGRETSDWEPPPPGLLMLLVTVVLICLKSAMTANDPSANAEDPRP